MKTEGNKVLRNVITQWISCLGPIQQVLHEYWPLLLKMGLDVDMKAKKVVEKMTKTKGVVLQKAPKKPNVVKAIFNLLCDIKVLLAIVCLMPLLGDVYGLI